MRRNNNGGRASPCKKALLLCFPGFFLIIALWYYHASLKLYFDNQALEGLLAAGGEGRIPLTTAALAGGIGSASQRQLQQPSILSSTGNTRGFHPVFVYSKVKPPRIGSYSQVSQDKVILALSRANDEKIASQSQVTNASNQSDKYFVDLASNDAMTLSNTLHLEQNGWKGLCMEPNPMYWYRLAAYRQCTIVGAFVGGTEDGKEVDVILSNHVYGGIVGEGFDNQKEKAEEKRNLVSISTVFQETLVPNVIDYMSLDVEGAESLVMHDFPFDTYKILFLTIERPKEDLRALLVKNGYKVMNKDLSGFGETLWFHEKSLKLTPQEVEQVACNAAKKCFQPKDYSQYKQKR
jgi:hypothetical protein